mmetsp:Transcript_14323/g.28779  ORF Transcript_14323/g.28779 Transcript_14323/m.28779 type:complete len:246 (-) Transcript_14323:675-1412(-)
MKNALRELRWMVRGFIPLGCLIEIMASLLDSLLDKSLVDTEGLKEATRRRRKGWRTNDLDESDGHTSKQAERQAERTYVNESMSVETNQREKTCMFKVPSRLIHQSIEREEEGGGTVPPGSVTRTLPCQTTARACSVVASIYLFFAFLLSFLPSLHSPIPRRDRQPFSHPASDKFSTTPSFFPFRQQRERGGRILSCHAVDDGSKGRRKERRNCFFLFQGHSLMIAELRLPARTPDCVATLRKAE